MRLSVIIPTLNEEFFIGKTIDCIKAFNDGFLHEIIVVDSGSKDNSILIAESKNCIVIKDFFNVKWKPLNLGASLATGDVLLFVDADTFMPKGFGSAIHNTLQKSNIVGGAFEFSFIEKNLLLNLVVWTNRFRYRIKKRYYGDQSIFVRKDIFDSIGGYPKRDILEASYLCSELEKIGNLKLIKMKAKTSARRFITGGILKVFWKDVKIWFLDSIGFSVEKYGVAYWGVNRKK
jgi:rSAM/selenodomain-associated transferase 2